MKPLNQITIVKEQAPYVRFKEYGTSIKWYDHEDVDVGFKADRTLVWIANFLASCGVCVLLLLAIGIVAQVPDSWLSWLILAVQGV